MEMVTIEIILGHRGHSRQMFKSRVSSSFEGW